MQDAVRAEVEPVLAGLGDIPDRRRHGLAEKVRRDRTRYENEIKCDSAVLQILAF